MSLEEKLFRRCSLGELDSCAELVTVNKSKKNCKLALDKVEEKFDEFKKYASAIEYLGFFFDEEGKFVDPDAKTIRVEKGEFISYLEDLYTDHAQTIEGECLDFPLIECVDIKDIKEARRLMKYEAATRMNEENARACAIVMPGQDSQIATFGTIREDAVENPEAYLTEDEVVEWLDYLKDKPQLQEAGDLELLEDMMTPRKTIELITKLGRDIKSFLLRDYVVIDCIHPYAIVGDDLWFTRDRLRHYSYRMPSKRRLKVLLSIMKLLWIYDFDWEWLNEQSRRLGWDSIFHFDDFNNIVKAIEHIDRHFESKRDFPAAEVDFDKIMPRTREWYCDQVYLDIHSLHRLSNLAELYTTHLHYFISELGIVYFILQNDYTNKHNKNVIAELCAGQMKLTEVIKLWGKHRRRRLEAFQDVMIRPLNNLPDRMPLEFQMIDKVTMINTEKLESGLAVKQWNDKVNDRVAELRLKMSGRFL